MRYKLYCDRDYYSTDCSVFCVDQDGSAGHYTCDNTTGTKVCRPGYHRASIPFHESCDGSRQLWDSRGLLNQAPTKLERLVRANLDLTIQQGQETFIGGCHLFCLLWVHNINSKLASCTSCRCERCCTQIIFSGPPRFARIDNYNSDVCSGWQDVSKNCTTEFNACASNPCQNGATCTSEQFSYMCICQPGYSGC